MVVCSAPRLRSSTLVGLAETGDLECVPALASGPAVHAGGVAHRTIHYCCAYVYVLYTLRVARIVLRMRGTLGRGLDVVIFAAYAASVDGDPPAWPGPCPCANPRWCKPLSPQPAPRPEIVAYHGSRSNTNTTGRGALPAWSAVGVPPANSGNWSSFDWSKVTTIGLFAPLEGPDGWDLLCTAHQHNVRVLPWAGAVFGRPSVSQLYLLSLLLLSLLLLVVVYLVCV